MVRTLRWIRLRARVAVLLGMVTAGLPALAAPMPAGPVRRVYTDRANGVSFSYPAGWLLNGDDDAATAKLRITGEAQAVAIVQLEGNFADEGPYKGTDFEAGAFAYAVIPKETEERCLATLDKDADAAQKPVAAMWKGLSTRRLDAQFGIAGTQDNHQIIAAYKQGKCYLFEVVIVSKSPEGPIKPLAPMRWQVIRGEFASVMQSVRFAAGER
jgi:hypothetical protein